MASEAAGVTPRGAIPAARWQDRSDALWRPLRIYLAPANRIERAFQT